MLGAGGLVYGRIFLRFSGGGHEIGLTAARCTGAAEPRHAPRQISGSAVRGTVTIDGRTPQASMRERYGLRR